MICGEGKPNAQLWRKLPLITALSSTKVSNNQSRRDRYGHTGKSNQEKCVEMKRVYGSIGHQTDESEIATGGRGIGEVYPKRRTETG